MPQENSFPSGRNGQEQQVMLGDQVRDRLKGVHWISNREAVLEIGNTDLGEWWRSKPHCNG